VNETSYYFNLKVLISNLKKTLQRYGKKLIIRNTNAIIIYLVLIQSTLTDLFISKNHTLAED